jgi:hypothetical protein
MYLLISFQCDKIQFSVADVVVKVDDDVLQVKGWIDYLMSLLEEFQLTEVIPYIIKKLGII